MMTTPSRSALIRVLTTIQNSARYRAQDILTFSGFLTDAELAEHVWACFKPLVEEDKARALTSLRENA